MARRFWPIRSAAGEHNSGTTPPEHRAVFVLVDYVPSTGGTTSQTRLEAAELVRRGWQVDVLTRRHSPLWRRTEKIDGVDVYRFGGPGYSKLSKAYCVLGVWWKLLFARQMDVVQVLMDVDYAVAACLAGHARRTVMMWATEGDAEWSFAGAKGVIRKTLIRGCGHVVLTSRMQVELAESGIYDSEIIPVPVDSSRFRPATDAERIEQRAALGITAATAIAFSGHLVHRKGVDLLLSAFRTMVEDNEDVHLLLLGSGEGRPESLEEQLRRDAETFDLSERITFAGAVQDVAPFLHGADIFCLPSWREGMPNSILEAMASGLVCVAPISAGALDLLADGAGVIPPSNAAEDLVAAMTPLLHDEPRCRTLRVAARRRAVSRHSVAAVIDEYERMWEARRNTAS
jgi:glycosyltransferase involved in cell wall biosynthesis